jgi:sugar phosphate isomerase/epimerase
LKPIAIQLYTVREAAEQDFPAVLRRVAEIGYKGVEFAGLHGHKPSEITAIVNELGLQVVSSHTSLPTSDNYQQIVDTETALGNKRIISGFGPEQFSSADGCKQAIDQFNEAVDLLKPYGLTFGMHNHWWEFQTIGGNYIYDVIMKEAPGIFSELDVYWTAYAKADPVEIVSRYKSRLPLLHIKDGTLKENAPHTAIGDGVLNIPAIINAADPNVLEWLIAELDEYDGDMFDAIKRSYDFLANIN